LTIACLMLLKPRSLLMHTEDANEPPRDDILRWRRSSSTSACKPDSSCVSTLSQAGDATCRPRPANRAATAEAAASPRLPPAVSSAPHSRSSSSRRSPESAPACSHIACNHYHLVSGRDLIANTSRVSPESMLSLPYPLGLLICSVVAGQSLWSGTLVKETGRGGGEEGEKTTYVCL